MRVKEKFFGLLTSEIEAIDCWTACNDGETAKATSTYLNGYSSALRDAEGLVEREEEDA